MKFDYIVGNPPFTSARGVANTGVRKIGNDFIKLMNRISRKAIYVLHAKLDSPTFYSELILNPHLKKIVFHKEKTFNIGDMIFTAHVLIDNESSSNTFIYTDNIGSVEKILPKTENTILSPIINESFVINSDYYTLADFWVRGKKYKNQITGVGKYEVITNLGKDDSTEFITDRDDVEDCTYGKWKIVFSLGARDTIKIAGPEYSIMSNIVALQFDTEEECRKVFEWIKETDVISKLQKFRTSGYNNKVLFEKIPIPFWLFHKKVLYSYI